MRKRLISKPSINQMINWSKNIKWLIVIGIIIIIALSIAIPKWKESLSTIRIERSIRKGDPELVMKAVKKSVEWYHPLELINQLIDEGYLDAAIFLYEYKTSHCSTYEMKYSSLYSHADFTKKATTLIYDALINAERMDEAWEYHPLEYENPNYTGNASAYYAYVSDVIHHYCIQNKRNEAKQFVNTHMLWFIKNVDNGKYRDEYYEYMSYDVKQRLMLQISEY